MQLGSTNSFIKYVVLLGVIFFVLFSLDTFFGVTYEPEEHSLNAEHKAKAHISTPDHGKETPAKAEPAKHVESAKPTENVTEESEKALETVEISAQQIMDQLIESYKTDKLAKISKPRKDIVIRYYRHKPDGKSAYELEKLGYYIHERPVDQKFEKYQSNAIFYGDSVQLQDIQIVAYTLLKEGLPIKEIKPSKFGDSWKSKSIEIGTDTTLFTQPTLKIEAIQKFNR